MGYYTIKDGALTHVKELPGSGSINEIAESLGYEKDGTYTVFLFDSKCVEILVCKKKTKDVIFALTKTEDELTYEDYIRDVQGVDWDWELKQSEY